MEKIFIAIILLNILASILASRRKKKKLREAAEKRAQAGAGVISKPENKVHKPWFRGFESKVEKPGAQPAAPAQATPDSGKSLLDQVAKELGISLKDAEPSLPPPSPSPTENPGFMEIISEPAIPEALKRPDAPRSYDEMVKEEGEPPIAVYTEKAAALPEPVRSKRLITLKKLKNRESFKQAFILKTIIDKPLALQKRIR